MTEYGQTALNKVRAYAQGHHQAQRAYLRELCARYGADADAVVSRALSNPVTMNFHIDRLAGNGKTILENLLEDGQYRGQFQTGTSNGVLGGSRLGWEQRMFDGAYPERETNRPKYGALNLLKYLDGASARFGSCFFALKPDMACNCTFAYGDSSTNPTTLCTADTFEGVLADLLRDVETNGKMLNQALSSPQEALAALMHPSDQLRRMGRNLDYCIETHIHGDVSLKTDVDSFYVDASYRGTPFEALARELCGTYDIRLAWIPERRISADEIGPLFRGPQVAALARRMDELLGSRGVINAYVIGQASRDSVRNPERWQDVGDPKQLFQLIKQLWHTTAYFG